MEEHENEDALSLAQLLVKRRKLIDLRKHLTNNTEKNNTESPIEVLNNDSNHVTPYSVEQPSISPPPYSPLTPLIPMTIDSSNNSQDQSATVTTPLEMHHPIATHSVPMYNKSSPLSSPLPLMSPDTQQLFNMLNEDENLLVNDNISENSDDSVLDPSYVIRDKVNIDESTSCSSLDVNERNEASISNLTSTEQQHNMGVILSAPPSAEGLTRPVLQIIEEQSTNMNDLRSDAEIGRPKKGRKRINPQLKSERKFNKYHNLAYNNY